ncbi:Zinc-finger domain of monoamine-oxidase A repressor R1 protein [Hibiscus syriacus]|uniref:Zinc-finger domain of monoamine-oxidase A repressor R1 protein n=1 Tax=Hibiscus syriacus TaxID=106335 RepID=A0A6A2YLH4_HIBSY|nr:Zinc-finger domain of monoamine-oxidase A repressor R1 protein [Hibiscus syriacus]
MAVVSTPASKIKEVDQTKGNGIRTCDSENGKSCHQCRQKRMNFLAPCKNLKKDKQCTIKYCHKCLLNRYGEKAEEVALLADWKCPKCRDICNCSLCMKKKGHNPTGILVYTAKKTGFSSASELLQAKGPENFKYERIVKDMCALPKNQTKESMATSPRMHGKENSFDGDCDSKVSSQNLVLSLPDEKKSKKMKREGLKELYNGNGDCEASLNKTCLKKPKTSKEASNKTMKGNGCLSNETMLKTEVQIDGASGPSKEQETKCAKTKKAGVLNGIKVLEITKRRDSTTSDEESRKKLKSKENFAGEEKNLKRQVPESNTIAPVKEKRCGVKSEDSGGSDGLKNDNACGKLQSVKKLCKDRKLDVDIHLPQGASLITVAGVDLPPNDVGHALQFLEFCAAFGENNIELFAGENLVVLDMKKGQAESVIREIIRGRGRCRLQYSPVVQIHMQLLSLIQKDMCKKFPAFSRSDNASWFQALGQCVSESQRALKEVSTDIYERGVDAYNMLDSSVKLKLLNILCDEALCTITLRNWIDKQNSKFIDSEKEVKEKIIASRDKEKQLRQKMHDEVAKVITEKGGTLSISEHGTLIAQIKKETAQVHEDLLQAMAMLPRKRERSDAVRTSPIVLAVRGHVFWKLSGYTSGNHILLQDFGTSDPVAPDEKWFIYDVEQKRDVEKYISLIRTKKLRIQKVSGSLPIAGVGEDLEHS